MTSLTYKSRKVFGLLLACTMGVAVLTIREARASPIGTWITEGGKSHVRIGACGGDLCGVIVWLKEATDPQTGKLKTDKNNADAGKRHRPLIGVPIVLGMKPSGSPNKWQGSLYNAADGKTYSGTLTEQGPDSLKLEGCALGGLVCKGQSWTRTK